jgi:hypothetical protein
LRAPVNSVIAAATLLALGLRVYVLLRPGLLLVTQYDDGPYFGSAVRLVHGVLPYRDYAFVQPPGITLLMAPAAALTYLTGTAWGLVLGRILTVLAGTAAVLLAGLLVRHRGLLAVALTCGIMAVYPPAAAASHTVLLEPWLVLACLAGAVLAFDGDRLTSKTSRLAWAGVLFGFGGAVKAWAIAPVVVLLVLCLPSLRRAGTFAAGVAAGFFVPSLPFAIVVPRQFYDSVIVAQLARIGPRIPVWTRVHDMLGLLPGQAWPHAGLLGMALAVAAVAVACQAAACLVARRPPPALDWWAMITAAVLVAMFLWPPFYASHYVAFLGPFLALSLALPIARLASSLRPAAGWAGAARRGPLAVGLTCLALMAIMILEGQPGSGLLPRSVPVAAIKRVIPPGACVVTDSASYLLLANRFISDVPRCSQMVDSLGTDLALSGGRRPSTGAPSVPAVQAAWRYAFRHAQYVVLTYLGALPRCARSPHPCGRIAWTPQLVAYFTSNFLPVRHAFHFTVYARKGLGAR